MIDSEMIWIWDQPMKKKNICCFVYYPNELVYFSKPIQLEGKNEWFKKESGILEYFEYQEAGKWCNCSYSCHRNPYLHI